MKQSEKYLKIKETVDKILTSSGRDLSHYAVILSEQLQDADFEEAYKEGKQNDISATQNILGFHSMHPCKASESEVKKQMRMILHIVKKTD